MACKSESRLTAIVAKMLEVAQEIELDLNAKDDDKERTGFIWACEGNSGRSLEVIDLIVAKAEDLNIDLKAKDKYGR